MVINLCNSIFNTYLDHQEHGNGAADASQSEGHESNLTARMTSQTQMEKNTQVHYVTFQHCFKQVFYLILTIFVLIFLSRTLKESQVVQTTTSLLVTATSKLKSVCVQLRKMRSSLQRADRVMSSKSQNFTNTSRRRRRSMTHRPMVSNTCAHTHTQKINRFHFAFSPGWAQLAGAGSGVC